MGLRINSSSVSQFILRQLRQTDSQQAQSLERLSTGLRINRSSDDPSGMAISEKLLSQTSAMKQAVENSSNAQNLISTAEASLQEVSAMLSDIRASLIFALNTGGSSAEQVAAEQDSVDAALNAIDKIASSARFGSIPLLDGNSAFDVTTAFPGSGIMAVHPLSLQVNEAASSTTFTVDVLSQAAQATLNLGAAAGTVVASGGPVTLRLLGPVGAQIIELGSGATRQDLEDAINGIRGNLGFYASNGVALTESFGSKSNISLQQIDGAGVYTQAIGTVAGRDAVATVNGIATTADGNTLIMNHRSYTGDIELRSTQAGGTAGRHTFDIRNSSGMQFQLDGFVSNGSRQILGLPDMSTTNLGSTVEVLGGLGFGGVLASLRTGGENDLFRLANISPRGTTTDPVTSATVPLTGGNAVDIVDAAIDAITSIRGFFGAFVSQTTEPNIDTLETGIQNLEASTSRIRDIDFARETAELTRAQVLFQAGISVLGQANVTQQTALQLLTG